MCRGYTNKAIARIMGVAEKTAENYVRQVYLSRKPANSDLHPRVALVLDELRKVA
jgi:DNA-binding NarL/FixJ family response regulator